MRGHGYRWVRLLLAVPVRYHALCLHSPPGWMSLSLLPSSHQFKSVEQRKHWSTEQINRVGSAGVVVKGKGTDEIERDEAVTLKDREMNDNDAPDPDGQESEVGSEDCQNVSRLWGVIGTQYSPNPHHMPFLERVLAQKKGGIEVKVAALRSRESRRFFGVSLARRGIQPVWIEVDNRSGDNALFLNPVKLDPNYYPAREAAVICHFASLKLLFSLGILSWIFFLPYIILLPLKLLTATEANRQMDEFFGSHSFPIDPIGAGSSARGFVFTSLDDGTKILSVDLISSKANERQTFDFSTPVPGIAVNYDGQTPMREEFYPTTLPLNCDKAALLKCLRNEPKATSNRAGNQEGDPANLVVVGDFSTVLAAFGSRWDETETITIATCVKTAKSFVLGSEYRYLPVSSLYMYGRSQDFALQRARSSINERLHLRLWLTPMVFEGKSVWVGQISRDIGVRFAKTWNLTTHLIDPAVDEARNYVVADLLQSDHLDRVAFVDGVGESTKSNPRRNLTGDPFVTDGKRALTILSPTKTSAKLLDW